MARQSVYSDALEDALRDRLRKEYGARRRWLEVWLRQDRRAEVRELAEEILETFEDLQVEREALRAMRFLKAACKRDAATPDLVRHIAIFLKRLEWEPRLQFAR